MLHRYNLWVLCVAPGCGHRTLSIARAEHQDLPELKLLQNVRAHCHLGKTSSWPLTSLLLLIWHGSHIVCVMDFTGQMMSCILGGCESARWSKEKRLFRRHKINQMTKQSWQEGLAIMAASVMLDKYHLISAFRPVGWMSVESGSDWLLDWQSRRQRGRRASLAC